jgi:hypothetical protein
MWFIFNLRVFENHNPMKKNEKNAHLSYASPQART